MAIHHQTEAAAIAAAKEMDQEDAAEECRPYEPALNGYPVGYYATYSVANGGWIVLPRPYIPGTCT